MTAAPQVDYQTNPSQYKHIQLAFDGEIATLSININEDAGIRPGYKLKLNSYDLGVDIELHDALQRIRFEHPEVRSVVVTSLKDRVFCSGANIFMLGVSTHGWKVNFCKFTNETRNGIEDSSKHDGLKFVAALNGACRSHGSDRRCQAARPTRALRARTRRWSGRPPARCRRKPGPARNRRQRKRR